MALPYCLDVGLTLWYHIGMKQRMSFRLSDEAVSLLERLAQANGISMTAILEMAIRQTAKKQEIHADSRLQAENQPGAAERD
jgi:predicted transcriptional regulator